jgi:hypothetical protein
MPQFSITDSKMWPVDLRPHGGKIAYEKFCEVIASGQVSMPWEKLGTIVQGKWLLFYNEVTNEFVRAVSSIPPTDYGDWHAFFEWKIKQQKVR